MGPASEKNADPKNIEQLHLKAFLRCAIWMHFFTMLEKCIKPN